MEWQAVVLTIQILLLAIGWVLFQRARGELSARAAETPVLTEIKALQNNIKSLLAELKHTADEKAEHLEQRCEDARAMLEILDSRLAESEQVALRMEEAADQCNAAVLRNAAEASPSAGQSVPLRLSSESIAQPLADFREGINLAMTNSINSRDSAHQQSRNLVFSLADAGEKPAAIARAARLSEGEVETLLGLRLQRK